MRARFPEMTLRSWRIVLPPLTKSCLNHRLRKLTELANNQNRKSERDLDTAKENGTMNRAERANAYHNSGYNCCQAVAAAFSDVTGLSEAQSLAIGGGWRRTALWGDLRRSVGAVMVLGMTHPYTDY